MCVPQILAVRGDSASNNDTMVDAMELELPEFGGAECRVRCLDHIINLVAHNPSTRVYS